MFLTFLTEKVTVFSLAINGDAEVYFELMNKDTALF